jgi:hypothetical protein
MPVQRTGVVVVVVVALLLLGLTTTVPINREKLESRAFYGQMTGELDALSIAQYDGDTLLAGWSTLDITPDEPVMLAGYGIRGPVDSVHDRLEVKAVVLDNGSFSAAVVSLDLLLFPGVIADSLKMMAREGKLPVDAVYPASIHTHNAYGHWEQSPAIQIAFGKYREAVVRYLLSQSVQAIFIAHNHRQGASLGYVKAKAPDYVVNRLDPEKGVTDDYLRAIVIEQESGARSVMLSYAAHPVVLDTKLLTISRDYPGYLTDFLRHAGYDQVVFMAGMVGSHTVSASPLENFDKAKAIGEGLGRTFLRALPARAIQTPPAMAFQQLDLKMPDPQVRISERLGLRTWLFRTLIGKLSANITALQVGEVLMLGMPCDFSGEIAARERLDSLASGRGLELMITSFNGDYIGYVSDDRYYDSSTSEEMRLMNWTGPHMGSYFSYVIRRILDKVQPSKSPGSTQ